MFYLIKKLLQVKGIAYRYDQLYNEVKRKKPQSIMEIGVWKGERAVKMIELAKKYNPTQSIHYFGFDLFEPMDEEKYKKEVSKQPPSIEAVEFSLRKTEANIYLYKGETSKTLPIFTKNPRKIDLVFIDGGHSLETVANDWNYVSQIIEAGSVVIFDDYWSNRTDAGSKVTVDGISKNEYEVTILPVIDSFDTTPFGHLDIQFAKVVKR